jgi:2-(1,2-epoxy-1,2-dihydrophenyl)acetyl-CoA isomerase
VEAIELERKGRVALLRLNRPKNLNALGPEIKAGLASQIPALMDDEGVGCIVITGVAEAFCAGGDLANMSDRGAPSVRERLKAGHAWTHRLLTGETPVVAAVNGVAAGAGFSLAMMCDIVLVAETAYFKPGFSGVGAVPDLGLALTLPRAVGMARAREILLTNRRVEAAEAVAIGLAARACPPADLMAEALKVAEQIAAGPRPALALTKLLLNEAYGSIERFLFEESMAQAVAFGSADFAEGVDAFLGKRRAQFGR